MIVRAGRTGTVDIVDAEAGESELLPQQTELSRERRPARVRRVARGLLHTDNTYFNTIQTHITIIYNTYKS